MNILVVTGIFPPDIGGPATYVPRLAECLLARGHKVSVVTHAAAGNGSGNDPFPVYRIRRSQSRLARCRAAVETIVDLARTADVILANGLAIQVACANSLARKPLVIKVVGDLAWERARNRREISDSFDVFQRRRYGIRIEAEKVVCRNSIASADYVITPSRFLADVVARWGISRRRIRVVPNAVDVPDALSPVRLPLTDRATVCTVGRLVPWKNIDHLIGALTSLPDIGLAIVGDGPDRGLLETLARRLGVEDRVFFAGARRKSEVIAIVKQCDVFALVSGYEGFPHSLAEAMLAGAAVLATDVGGNSELVNDGHNGILVSHGDPMALQSALHRLTTCPDERQRLGLAGRASASHFSWSRLASETMAVLEEAVRTGR